MLDAGDFIDIVEHNRGDIDLTKLQAAWRTTVSARGAEILRLIDDIDAGRTIQV